MMETQDMRIDQLEEIMKVTVKTQTGTLRILKDIATRVEENSARMDEHSRILQEHSAILQEHSAILQEHSAILQEHSAILLGHSARLENLENLMSRVLDELVAIKEILASPRGMGFIPEPDETD